MSNVHTATLPDGTEVKRTSAKATYSHVVAVPPPTRETVLERLGRDLERTKAELAEYEQALATIDTTTLYREVFKFLKGGASWSTTSDKRNGHYVYLEESATEDEARAELRKQIATYVESATATRGYVESHIKSVADGPEFVGQWGVIGWRSRLDLAEAAARQASTHTRTQAVIIPATVVTK